MTTHLQRGRWRRMAVSFFAAVLLLSFGVQARADLRLAGIFSDHMVLQRDRPIVVWGWADKSSEVAVQFAGRTATAIAGDDGQWQVKLDALPASAEGRELIAESGGERVVARDVLVGDVWHASGQSNMEWTVDAIAGKLPVVREHIAAAKLPSIRFRKISENAAQQPQADVPVHDGWSVCSPETVGKFSAAAYYFARKLHADLEVPIGVIVTSRGGTPIEPYIPRAAFQSHPTLKKELALGDAEDLQGIWKLPGGVRARDANWLPGRLFNSRLAPIARFAVCGAIWYQGESNCGDGEDPRDYEHKMRALIRGWREALASPELPIYFVQLPSSGARAGWPYLREQQRLAADLPHTGMVVTIDLQGGDIHPPNKIDVGERLARWALADAFGKNIPRSGPLPQRVEVADGAATVHFAHADGGLMIATKEGLAAAQETPDAKLEHFELADKSGAWRAAEATISGDAVVVRSKNLPDPVAVRYAYATHPRYCRLYNRTGLPASPFCSHPELLRYEPDLPKD